MDIKIIGIVAVIIILFSVNQCEDKKNNLASDLVEGSTRDVTHIVDRESKISRWISNKEYKQRFKNKNKYFRTHKTYPAYIEMDTLGNRRMLEIPYEPRFYYRVASGRLKEEFKTIHIKETLNRRKKLLSLHIVKKDGIDVYTGVWVTEDVFERESKKLQKYGITPPVFFD